jgi:purine-binding chemotaxis protein CheW
MEERNSDLFAIDSVDDIENMYLTFEVQGEEYAVNIGYVVEIVGLQKISEVPDVPHYIKGVINLRGTVIPVMDVRLRFGLPWREYGDRTTVVVLELDGVPTGLVVDQVTDVISIPEHDVAPPPRRRSDTESAVVKGLGRRDDGVSIVLDVPALLLAQTAWLDLPQEMLDAV